MDGKGVLEGSNPSKAVILGEAVGRIEWVLVLRA